MLLLAAGVASLVDFLRPPIRTYLSAGVSTFLPDPLCRVGFSCARLILLRDYIHHIYSFKRHIALH